MTIRWLEHRAARPLTDAYPWMRNARQSHTRRATHMAAPDGSRRSNSIAQCTTSETSSSWKEVASMESSTPTNLICTDLPMNGAMLNNHDL